MSAQDCYKLVVSSVVPRPIAWVVTQDAAGMVNAAPYSFFNAFSDNPVVVGFGAGPAAAGVLKDTADNIRQTGEFVVNLVPESADPRHECHRHRLPAGRGRAGRGRAEQRSPPPRSSRRASPRARSRWNASTFQLIPAGTTPSCSAGWWRCTSTTTACWTPRSATSIRRSSAWSAACMAAAGTPATDDRIEVPRLTVAEWEAKKKAAE